MTVFSSHTSIFHHNKVMFQALLGWIGSKMMPSISAVYYPVAFSTFTKQNPASHYVCQWGMVSTQRKRNDCNISHTSNQRHEEKRSCRGFVFDRGNFLPLAEKKNSLAVQKVQTGPLTVLTIALWAWTKNTIGQQPSRRSGSLSMNHLHLRLTC